jgi:hypothetical protein
LRSYEVLNGHCECSDYLRHGSGNPCKHRLALAFYKFLDLSESLLDSAEGDKALVITKGLPLNLVDHHTQMLAREDQRGANHASA